MAAALKINENQDFSPFGNNASDKLLPARSVYQCRYYILFFSGGSAGFKLCPPE